MSRYIDADKLQEDFKELHGGKRSLLIDTAPTADVRENVKGEWQVREEIESDCYIVRCSNCHARVRVGCNVLCDSKIEMNNYCPNCGADMRTD